MRKLLFVLVAAPALALAAVAPTFAAANHCVRNRDGSITCTYQGQTYICTFDRATRTYTCTPPLP